MILVISRNGVPVRLTTERWEPITSQHPEMATMRAKVLETVATPDMVQAGDYGELLAIRHYPTTPLTSKHLIVAYRESAADDGFILTAYLARRPSARREALWKR
jgi:hypothetical protein